jgi:uncharacterized repeat protein (TIGR04042 family)
VPEMHFSIRWPDGALMRCYSPSLVVREFLEVGRAYPLREFLERSRTMLNIGSERVRAKYGFACSAAMDQLATIEERSAACGESDLVTVTGFEVPGAPEQADGHGHG